VENVAKRYRLGTIGTGSLKADMMDWWNRKVRNKKDRFQEITEEDKDPNGYIWALQDISFEIREGEVLGIIGRNGAGKSTLLKILSRVTRPTRGRIRGRGRIASLLEVGTGFHEELTGRENIFLNGNILGMNNREIRSRFEEILEFSGVQKYIDTPVKRYSSGMYVRLAFAVAAHLDPEILIVDEVLAVGDAEFQKKCLGKMKDVSEREGRTVLFVSHNMQAVQNLCSRAILLQSGRIVSTGEPRQVIAHYLHSGRKYDLLQQWSTPGEAPGNQHIRIRRVEIQPMPAEPGGPVDIRTPLLVSFEFWNLDPLHLCIGLQLLTLGGECIFDVSSPSVLLQQGIACGECLIPGNFLNDGAYSISLFFVKDTSILLYSHEECLSIEVADYRENVSWFGKWEGYVRPDFPVLLQMKLPQNPAS